jgi:hypothetical protein
MPNNGKAYQNSLECLPLLHQLIANTRATFEDLSSHFFSSVIKYGHKTLVVLYLLLHYASHISLLPQCGKVQWQTRSFSISLFQLMGIGYYNMYVKNSPNILSSNQSN